MRVLRAFGREEEQKREFSARNDALTKEQNHVGRISVLLNPVTYVIINLAIVALIRTGALRVESGALSQGDVIALYNYMSQILVELIKLANLVLNIPRARQQLAEQAAGAALRRDERSPRGREPGNDLRRLIHASAPSPARCSPTRGRPDQPRGRVQPAVPCVR